METRRSAWFQADNYNEHGPGGHATLFEHGPGGHATVGYAKMLSVCLARPLVTSITPMLAS